MSSDEQIAREVAADLRLAMTEEERQGISEAPMVSRILRAIKEARRPDQEEIKSLREQWACVGCGAKPSPDSDLYTAICHSCRRCFECAQAACTVCGDEEGLRMQFASLLKRAEKAEAEMKCLIQTASPVCQKFKAIAETAVAGRAVTIGPDPQDDETGQALMRLIRPLLTALAHASSEPR